MRRVTLLLVVGVACALFGGSSAAGAPGVANAPSAVAGNQCMVIYSVYPYVFGTTPPPPAYDHQYLNLLNRCSATVNISALKWRYSWTGGNPGQAFTVCNSGTDPLSCMLPGGHYWLIQMDLGTASQGGANALPTPDHHETSFILPSSGGIAVWIDNNPTTCAGSRVDLVGWNSPPAGCVEGTQAPTPLSNGSEALQRSPVCQDTDNNSADFVKQNPTPRNSSFTPAVECGITTAAVLAGASATRSVSGVLVRWRTATEAGVLGFNVYRQSASGLVRVNRSLVGAAFYSARGVRHSLLDRAAPGGRVVYRIQSVGVDGSRTWLARVAVRS